MAMTDRAVGMEFYATHSPPCRAKVKVSNEDFRVEEIASIQGMVADERPDFFPLYKVENRFTDTLHMVEILSKALKSRISFGGLKDKRALSTQYVTPTSLRSLRQRIVVDEKFTARLVGYVPNPMTRNAVIGNRFEIVLRDCCDNIGEAIQEALHAGETRNIPNFYGWQRFGTGGGSHLVGRDIVMGEFSQAVRRLMVGSSDFQDRGGPIWEAMEGEKFEEALSLLPPGKDVERRLGRELVRHKGDWIRAIRAIPLRLRRLYVHAFQSYLFNRSLSVALAEGEDISTYHQGDNWAPVSEDGFSTPRVYGVRDQPVETVVPMIQVVGYAFRDYGSRFDECVKEVLASERVHPGSFYVREMQEVSSEGGFRRPHLAIKSHAWKVEDGTASLGFTLARGQYATVLLREIIKEDDPMKAGLV